MTTTSLATLPIIEPLPLVFDYGSQPTLAELGQAANLIAAQHIFHEYRARRAANTIARQDDDLALFAACLADAGVGVANLGTDPLTWQGVTWGLVSGFVQWQLAKGYAIGSVNVRLATVKVYAKLAMQAGVLHPAAYTQIRAIVGYRRVEGRNIDQRREQTRVGAKKARWTTITGAQADQLKEQPDTPQGRRDAFLLCILLDHGLRVGEVVRLQVENFDLRRGTMTFYREKVDLEQTHELERDTLRAALAYLKHDTPATGPALLGSRKNGTLAGTMSQRAINARVGQLGRAIGIENLSPHDLRHAWATAAARGGTDIKALQDAGGWASPAMPLQYAESAEIANEGVRLKR